MLMVDIAHRGRPEPRQLVRDAGSGALAGLVGGLAFGALMAMMNMLPMVGMLAGSESALVGFAIHMVISAVIGAIYGGLVSLVGLTSAHAVLPGIGIGVAYGFVWWILGPLVLMPIMLGMGPQFASALTQMNLMSLMGHLMYGALLGGAFAMISGRGEQRSSA